MKMKWFYICKLFVLFLVMFSCKGGDKDQVQITGDFLYSRGEMLYLHEILVYDKVPLDSTILRENGSFNFSVPVNDVVILWLGTSNDNYITLICEKGEVVELSGDIRSLPATYDVKGSPGSEKVLELHQYTLSHYQLFDTLTDIWEKRKYDPDKLQLRDSLDSVALGVYMAQEDFVVGFVNENMHSLAAIIALYQVFGRVSILDEIEHIELYEKTALKLREAYPGNQHVNELSSRVEKNKTLKKEQDEIIRRLQPGNPVPELSLPDRDGAPVAISDYMGYTLLINFWSATSPLSRKQNQELVTLSKRFSNRGFLLFNVSFDNLQDVWKKAITLDKLPGIHVNDQRDWTSPVVKMFNIPDLPYYILVDREGNIVEKGLSIEEINQKLYEILPSVRIPVTSE
jgi:peroxiredoxin